MSTTQSAPEELAPAEDSRRRSLAEWPYLDVAILLGAVAVLLLAALLTLGPPGKVLAPWGGWALPGSCTFKVAMGVGCPGCGLTRCFVSMAHGDLVSAYRFNPVGILLFGLLVAQLPYRGWRLWRFSQGETLRLATKRQLNATLFLLGSVFVLLLVQWGVRLSMGNLP